MTELTRLQLLTDWTPCIKPLLLKPSFVLPSPPPSPLSLSPHIVPLPFTLPIVSSSLSQTHFSSLFLYCPTTELLVSKITDITKDKKTTEKGTLTPGCIPLVLVIQMPYIIAMPYLGTLRIFFFEGANITNFLNWYKLMYTDFQVEEKEKIWRLPLYCKMFISKYIESVIQSSEIT